MIAVACGCHEQAQLWAPSAKEEGRGGAVIQSDGGRAGVLLVYSVVCQPKFTTVPVTCVAAVLHVQLMRSLALAPH